ncbi:sensor histidine kinase [Candidatus Parcubacteria bacterium]|nr:MAG: sensor histidine kinase [Candidatus Parcubacteria bacterium]
MAKFKNSFFLRQSYQVIYGVTLILLIPIFIILNTVSSVSSFQKNIDISLQRQALSLGQMFDSTVFRYTENYDDLQDKVMVIKESNSSLRNFDVLVAEGESFKVVASFDESKLGKSRDDLNYVIAWHKNEAIGTLVSGVVETGSDERLWEIVLPLHDESGQKQALLSLQMSLKIMDELAKDTLTKSYVILSITILVVILLLALNTRLFEHALLFKKLKEVDRMKDEFISIASHELRTPITTIKGFLSMMLEGDYGQLNKDGEKGFKIMEASVNRLGNLVEDLLNVSRIEQNRLVVKAQPVDTAVVLNSLADEFDLRLEQKGLKFVRQIPEDLPQIWADEDKFRQVVINLLGNAVKYTKKGEVELIGKKENEQFLTIMVKDSGIGMSAEERAKLFEKFYRIQGEETRGIIGTGLGLWITKQLVELMGGNIYVDSIKHVGSQFYFTIPIYNPQLHKLEVETKNKK